MQISYLRALENFQCVCVTPPPPSQRKKKEIKKEFVSLNILTICPRSNFHKYTGIATKLMRVIEVHYIILSTKNVISIYSSFIGAHTKYLRTSIQVFYNVILIQTE